jgi:multiple sugar transport system substrate-binding protein
MRIQGEYGAAIPAYIGTENSYINAFDNYDYRIAVESVMEMFPYGVQSPNNPSRPEWKPKVQDELLKAYTGRLSVKEALENMQGIVENAIKNY